MRDDIHKHAPVPRRWRGVMRYFQSEADIPNAPQALERALALDIGDFIGPMFLRSARKSLNANQLALQGIPVAGFAGDPSIPLSDLERATCEKLARVQPEHSNGEDALHRAISEVMNDRLVSFGHSMVTTWAVRAKGDPAAKRAADALRETIQQCNVGVLVRDVLVGNSERFKRKPKAITLDSNLLAGSKRK